MKFARIIIQAEESAFFNMALDEAISLKVRAQLSPPTLRFYQWDRSSVSIGRFQKHSDIDSSYCHKKGYPIVRRPTGGRAILHGEELTYSFSSRFDSLLFSGNLLEDYSLISRALAAGLRQVGVEAEVSRSRRQTGRRGNPACFKSVSYGEISIEDRKVIGSAQKRYRDGFLQQGTILTGFSEEDLRNVLTNKEQEGFGEIGSLRDYVADLNCDTLRDSMKKAFESTLNIKLITDRPSQDELKAAKELESVKYSTEQWNMMR